VNQRKVAIVGGIVLALAACSAAGSQPPEAPEFTPTPTAEATSAPDVTPEWDPASEYTAAQQYAIESAQSYLGYSAFSRKGLIDQLVIEDYATADARLAVDWLDVDWKEQAAKSAQAYLDHSSFSRTGLIKQLEYAGYTHDEAVFGVDSVGL
jgi:hypothetical protein